MVLTFFFKGFIVGLAFQFKSFVSLSAHKFIKLSTGLDIKAIAWLDAPIVTDSPSLISNRVAPSKLTQADPLPSSAFLNLSYE